MFGSCVWYSDRANDGWCVLIKDIGRRPPLQLQQCSYQGQQGDVKQSVRGNYKTRFWGGDSLYLSGLIILFLVFGRRTRAPKEG